MHRLFEIKGSNTTQRKAVLRPVTADKHRYRVFSGKNVPHFVVSTLLKKRLGMAVERPCLFIFIQLHIRIDFGLKLMEQYLPTRCRSCSGLCLAALNSAGNTLMYGALGEVREGNL